MARPSWGHVSRHCVRCGKVGPRVFSQEVPAGWIHAYCRSTEEKKAEHKRQAAEAKRQKELLTAHAALACRKRKELVSDVRFYADSEPNDWRADARGNEAVMRAVNQFLGPGDYPACLTRFERLCLLGLVAEALEAELADGVQTADGANQ